MRYRYLTGIIRALYFSQHMPRLAFSSELPFYPFYSNIGRLPKMLLDTPQFIDTCLLRTHK